VASTFGQLLMSLIGADTMPDAYKQSQAAAASLPPRLEPISDAPRSMVMSHREWIMTHRIRAGVAHQWREFLPRMATWCYAR